MNITSTFITTDNNSYEYSIITSIREWLQEFIMRITILTNTYFSRCTWTWHKDEHGFTSTTEVLTTSLNEQTLIKYSSENHDYCKAIMQVAIVACLGMKDSSGRGAMNSRKESPEKFPSRRSCFKGKGKMVIFTVWQPHENDTIGTGSTNWDRGLWNHLIRSYGCRVTAVRSLGRNRIKICSFLLLTDERPLFNSFGRRVKIESVLLGLRFQTEKAYFSPKKHQSTFSLSEGVF